MKKLIEVLELISDCADVRVFNSNGDEIAKYDGKDSIPENLNGELVNKIYAGIDYCGNGIPYVAIDLI